MAQQQPVQASPPPGPWKPGTENLDLTFRSGGRPNPGWGTVATQNQELTGMLEMFGYLLSRAALPDGSAPARSDQHDYYAVNGHMSHAVSGYGQNALSVGYYATEMTLDLVLVPDVRTTMTPLAVKLPGSGQAKVPTTTARNGRVWDAGPATTVGSNTTSFSIGVSASAGATGQGPMGSVGLNTSFGSSFSSPDVTTTQAMMPDQVKWKIGLPGVGFQSPGMPMNPLPPSSGGYRWDFGAIFELPAGMPFALRVRPRVVWAYDWTRGIRNDTKTWEDDALYTFV